MINIYVKRVNGSIGRLTEEITLSWSNQMKNDVGGKLISLEDRREKVWTVIVLSHFSNELIGFLSNAETVENLQLEEEQQWIIYF